MTTTTGAIGLAAVQAEFGGANPISLSEYYRGGARVPAGTLAGTSGAQIATSGAIRLGDFRGVAAFAITNPLTGGTYTDNDAAPGSAACTMSVGSDGHIGFVGAASGDLGGQDWGTPTTAGIGSGYWVRVTLTSGAFSASDGSGWLQLSTSRNWTRNRPTGGSGKTGCTCTVEVATDSGGANIVASGSFALSAVHT